MGTPRNPKGWLVGVPALREPDGWTSVPRATLGTGTGSGLWRKGTGKAQPPKTNKQQNEAIIQTKTQSHGRGNE